MHLEVEEFLRSDAVQVLGWQGVTVVEVGAADWNGRARDYFDGWATWIGIDLQPGDGVDYVGDAVEILRTIPDNSYDRAVSTEVLEHASGWREILSEMLRVLVPSGYLVCTCASPGRPPHGATGTPLPLPGEYYRGVGGVEFMDAVSACRVPATVEVLEVVPNPGDLRAVVRKD